MAANSIIKVIISGDAKGAIKAFAETDAAAASTAGSVGKVAAAVPMLGLVVAAAAVAIAGVLLKIGGDFQGAFNKIRVGTGETGPVLDSLKDSFDKVFANTPASMDVVGSAITVLHQKLGLMGTPLEDLSGKFIKLSRITGTDVNENIKTGTSLLNMWNVPAEQAGNTLDVLFRAGQQSGGSFAEFSAQLTKSAPVLQELGFNLNQSAAMTALLAKNGIDLTDVMPGLTKAVKTGAKEGKDAGTVWKDTFDKIKNAPTDTKAAGDAIEVFGGKAGPKLAGLIRQGKLSYEDMLKSISSGDTIDQAAKDTQTWGSKLEILKHRAMELVEPLATKLFGAITDAVSNFMPVFDGWLKAIQKGFDWLGEHKIVLEGVGAVIGIILVAAFVSLGASAAGAAIGVLAALFPIVLIVAAIAGLVAGLVYAYNHWTWFHDAVQTSVAWLKTNVPPAFEKIKAGVMTAFNWLKEHVPPIWEDLKRGAKVAADFFMVTVLPKIQEFIAWAMKTWNDFSTWFQAYWGPFQEAVGHVWNVIQDVFNVAFTVISAIVSVGLNLLKQFWDNWGGSITSVIGAIWDQIKLVIRTAIQVVKDIIQVVLDAINGDWGKVWNDVKNLISVVWDGIVGTVKNGITIVLAFLGGIGSTVRSLASSMWDGITDAFKGMVNAIIRLWNALDFSIHVKLPDILGGASIDTPDLIPDIPYLANGAFVTKPTLAVIGDAGPEVVLPLSRPSRMAALLAQAGLGGGGQAPAPQSTGDSYMIHQEIYALDPHEAARSASIEARWFAKTAGV